MVVEVGSLRAGCWRLGDFLLHPNMAEGRDGRQSKQASSGLSSSPSKATNNIKGHHFRDFIQHWLSPRDPSAGAVYI